jgi:hypothetical protein
VAIPEHIVAESPERTGNPEHPVAPTLEQSPKPLSSTSSAVPSSAQAPKSCKAQSPKMSTPRASRASEPVSPISPNRFLEEGAALLSLASSPPKDQSSPPKDHSPGMSFSMLSKVSMKAGAADYLLPTHAASARCIRPATDANGAAKMKPALLAEWDLSHVLAQLNQVKQVKQGDHGTHAAAAATGPTRRSIFKENPDPSTLNEYHLGIAEHPAPTHLEFQCGRFCVTNEGTSLRPHAHAGQASGKDAPIVRLPEQWWISTEAAAAAIKKVARQELEDNLQKDRSKQDEPKGLRLPSSSSAAARKKPTLAAGTMPLGDLLSVAHIRIFVLLSLFVRCLRARTCLTDVLFCSGMVLEQAALTKTHSSNINVLQIQRVSGAAPSAHARWRNLPRALARALGCSQLP